LTPLFLQVIAGVKHLVEGGELEGEVMHSCPSRRPCRDQGEAVVIAVAAQEHHATGILVPS